MKSLIVVFFSIFVAELGDNMSDLVKKSREIEDYGGMVKAVEDGYLHRLVADEPKTPFEIVPDLLGTDELSPMMVNWALSQILCYLRYLELREYTTSFDAAAAFATGSDLHRPSDPWPTADPRAAVSHGGCVDGTQSEGVSLPRRSDDGSSSRAARKCDRRSYGDSVSQRTSPCRW